MDRHQQSLTMLRGLHEVLAIRRQPCHLNRMRLWSLHPRDLDAKGLVALWREGLLARAVLMGKSKGYRFHPQLERFRARRDPVRALDCYLSRVLDEARTRGYQFDAAKINYRRHTHQPAPVTRGQLAYEWATLLGRLRTRDPERWRANQDRRPAVHPCFRVVPGEVEPWERPQIGSSFGASPRAWRKMLRSSIGSL